MKGIFDFEWCVWLFCFSHVVKASPISQGFDLNLYHNTKSSKTTPVDISAACVYNENVYRSGESFTTDNPCETCTCKPPGYTCTTKSCEVKPGCKAIQKANKCCSEYVCECERNGKIYGNGEKLEEPDPCKVCYCKGGEIKCTTITCYSRSDCEPVHVEGKCCPKYDHCPPLEMKDNSTSFKPTPVVIVDIGSLDTKNQSEIDFSNNSLSSIGPFDLSVENSDKENLPSTTTEVVNFTSANLTNLENNSVFDFLEENDTATESSNFTDLEVDYGDEQYDLKSEPSDITKEVVILKDNSTEIQNITALENENLEMENVSSTTPEGIVTIVDDGELLGNESETVSVETTTESLNSSKEELGDEKWEIAETNGNIDLKNGSVEEDLRENETVSGNIGSGTKLGEEFGAPGLKMVNAEQMEFLHVGEEPPVYVDPPASVTKADGEKKESASGVVVVPETTPITVEMTKVS